MLREAAATERSNLRKSIECDLAVIGGGLAGVCCAITAAREGLKVVLVNDRPVLGGNASSEVRLWVLGATSHMGNNNRWAREGGVIDEILVENTFRNPEGNPLLFDAILLEKASEETNIQLLLNTAIYAVDKDGPDRIARVRGFCSQNSTEYSIAAPLFCDASGDGIVGFLAGAAFRMGAEKSEEFGEKFAPEKEYGELLGHSLYFYTKDVGRPVEFVPPSFALQDITKIPRYRKFNSREQGCQLWWIEYGGRLDTVHDAEEIKWELWRIVYGVWNYVKNSGRFPEAETLTLEWVGQISGKRESRRFEGDYILTQQDLVQQRRHFDAVSFGGWAIDLHPADGVFSELPACNQWHLKGVYGIPYRAMYSRNIENLFLAGRLISASHVAFGSTRVMATCAHNAQAVAHAACICSRRGWKPKQLAASENVAELQRQLQRTGQYIPHVVCHDPLDLAQQATVSATSHLVLDRLNPSGEPRRLSDSWGMLLPLKRGKVPKFRLFVDPRTSVKLRCELRGSSRLGNFTPDVLLAEREVAMTASSRTRISTPHSRGRKRALALSGVANRESFADGNLHTVPPSDERGPTEVIVDFDTYMSHDQYVMMCIDQADVDLYCSDRMVSGILAVHHGTDRRVAEKNKQQPPFDIGIESFELWCPLRRPQGRNLAIGLEPGIDCFGPDNVLNGIARPTEQPNAWVADWDDPRPRLTLSWPEPQRISRVELSFDNDFDHPMESVLMGHPERVMPSCVRAFRVLDGAEREISRCDDNHQTRRVLHFHTPVTTSFLHVELKAPSVNVPAALMEIRCYGEH